MNATINALERERERERERESGLHAKATKHHQKATISLEMSKNYGRNIMVVKSTVTLHSCHFEVVIRIQVKIKETAPHASIPFGFPSIAALVPYHSIAQVDSKYCLR